MHTTGIQIAKLIAGTLPFIAVIVGLAVGGSLLSTWLKIKNGYPVSNFSGVPLHPTSDRAAMNRIARLAAENASLRAELDSMKDRLESLERIATDQPSSLGREIDALAIDR